MVPRQIVGISLGDTTHDHPPWVKPQTKLSIIKKGCSINLSPTQPNDLHFRRISNYSGGIQSTGTGGMGCTMVASAAVPCSPRARTPSCMRCRFSLLASDLRPRLILAAEPTGSSYCQIGDLWDEENMESAPWASKGHSKRVTQN